MINTSNYREEIRTIKLADNELADKAIALKQLLERLCKEATQSEAMQFSTLFSRIVFIAQKYNLPKRTEWELQNFRVKVKQQVRNNTFVDLKTYKQSEQAIEELCKHLAGEIVTDKELESDGKIEITPELSDKESSDYNDARTLIEDTIRVQILKMDRDELLEEILVSYLDNIKK